MTDDETLAGRITSLGSIATQYNQLGPQYIKAREKERASGVLSAGEEFIRSHITDAEGKSLLDVGCGDGHDLLDYKEYGFKELSGVDPSTVMVQAAIKLHGANGVVKLGSWTNLDFQPESIDYLIGRSSIHYTVDLDEAYTEAAKVLKPGGKIIIVSPHPEKVGKIVRVEHIPCVQNIIKDEVTITYPLHIFEDYFAEKFNEFFDLEKVKVWSKKTESGKELPSQLFGKEEPVQFGFVAIRR